jgi:hypothetical protein
MSATLLGFLSAVLSAMCLVLLAASDSKRTERRPAFSSLGSLRPLALTVAIVPGLVLAMTGRWVAFLIWLGATAMFGWMIAALFSALRPQTLRRDSEQQPTDRN